MEIVRLDPQVRAEVYHIINPNPNILSAFLAPKRAMRSWTLESGLTVIDLPSHLLVYEPTQGDQPYLDEGYHPQHRPRQRIHGDIIDRFGDAGIAIGIYPSGVFEDRAEFRDLPEREEHRSDDRLDSIWYR